jgi:GT2 family glycosyltransferase
VIPNFNGERYLRETIESVLGQSRPPDEVLVVDGGSTDGSLDIVHGYAGLQLICEPDRGQADAIDKGFRRLGSDLVGWVNSDDRLLPEALARVAEKANVEPRAVLIHGDAELVDEWGRIVGFARSVDLEYERMRSGRGRVVQPGSFYRRSAVLGVGGVRPEFHLLMDLDLWIRLLRSGPASRIDAPLAQFRVHSGAKSSQLPWRYYQESFRIARLHESERLARAWARRLLGALRHGLVFTLGLSRNRVRDVVPPHSIPTVSLGLDVSKPATLEVLHQAGQVEMVGMGGEIEIHSLSSLESQRSVRGWGPAIVVLFAPSPVRASSQRRLETPISFAMVEAGQEEGAYAAGIPRCRVGDILSAKDWARAVRVARGQWPGDVGG